MGSANPVGMAYPTGVRALAILKGLFGKPTLADDAFGGLNVGHAMWRAKQNWPGASVLPMSPAGHAAHGAAPANPIAQQAGQSLTDVAPVTLEDLLRWFPKKMGR